MASKAEEAKAAYRELVKKQRQLPLEEQWRMAPLIREAKAKALVEVELERMNLR